MNKNLWSAALAVAAICLTTSCGGKEVNALCNESVAKLKSCNLLTGPADYCKDVQGEQDEGIASCENDCVQAASCAQLNDAFCGGGGSAVSACWQSCSKPSETFQCGDGTSYANHQKCDGFDDCESGVDEKGCPMFTCQDKSEVIASWRCDGAPDCEDASDELGCPTFTCKNGGKVPATAKCDSETDCADGSDELGCPEPIEFMCTEQ